MLGLGRAWAGLLTMADTALRLVAELPVCPSGQPQSSSEKLLLTVIDGPQISVL